MNPALKRWLIVALLLALILGAIFARAADAPPPSGPNPAPEPSGAHVALLQQIEAILERTHTPGAGVALVRREGPEWIAGIGLADVAAHRPVTSDTLVRIGSVSKSFVALSILKLQEEEIRRFVWWHSFITSVMLTVVSVYLAYWGVIGLRIWV